jgi:hypothetical protein
MAIHEYEVHLFLEIDGEEEDPLAIAEAVTSLIDEEIHSQNADQPSTRCGIRFHDVNEVTAKKT